MMKLVSPFFPPFHQEEMVSAEARERTGHFVQFRDELANEFPLDAMICYAIMIIVISDIWRIVCIVGTPVKPRMSFF